MDVPNNLTLLVIDDEEDFCFFVRENLLRAEMGEVFVATTGAHGIELAKENAPDIILLDLVMPDMSGEDVAAALKDNPDTAGIPIVYITALATDEDVEGTKIGNDYMLAKPLRTKKLIQTIRKIVSH